VPIKKEAGCVHTWKYYSTVVGTRLLIHATTLVRIKVTVLNEEKFPKVVKCVVPFLPILEVSEFERWRRG
jgi:hypothetical protein